jgi:hypothetical protein
METKLQSQSLSTESRDWLKAYFDGLYAAPGHLHTGVYSPVGHDHAGVYAPAWHDHAGVYSPVGHTHTAQQVLYHHLNSATLAAGATSYITLSIAGVTGLNGLVWPLAGSFTSMAIRINSQQPASGSLVFTLMMNLADTPLVTTVPAGTAASSNLYSSVAWSWTAGALLTIKIKNNATAASAAITSWSIVFQSSI